MAQHPSVDGPPAGAQLVAPARADWLLLDCGQLLQERTDWHLRQPPAP